MQKGVDYIGTSVVYFCHDGKGNVVMQKRSKNTRDEHGRWDIGGGGVEIFDSIEETLKKEVKEELCAEVLEFEFLGYRDVQRTNEAGIKTHWLALDFKARVDPDRVKNGEPHKFDDLKWFTKNTIPPEGQIHSQLPIFLEKYKDVLWK